MTPRQRASGEEAYGCFSRLRRFSGIDFRSPPVNYLVMNTRLVPSTPPLSVRHPICPLLLYPHTCTPKRKPCPRSGTQQQLRI